MGQGRNDKILVLIWIWIGSPNFWRNFIIAVGLLATVKAPHREFGSSPKNDRME